MGWATEMCLQSSERATDRVVALYSPQMETAIAVDASSSELGAVLLQRQEDGQDRPVAFASRSMPVTEQHYSQVEKEALAVTWACEKFSDYVIGLMFKVQTDHNTLVPVLSTKRLDGIPPRIQRLIMCLILWCYAT